MSVLSFYRKTNSFSLAKIYLEANGIKSFHVSRADFPADKNKPWRIWESKYQNKDSGFPVGEFSTKKEAETLAKELAQWAGIPYLK